MGRQGQVWLDAELQHIQTYLEQWVKDWCGTKVQQDDNKDLTWHLKHESVSCWLLLALRIARKRFPARLSEMCQEDMDLRRREKEHRMLLLNLSTRLFSQAVECLDSVCMTHRASIFPVAASIMLNLGGRRDIILRTALRMAGEPGEPFVSSFVRDSGNQLLVMLWFVSLILLYTGTWFANVKTLVAKTVISQSLPRTLSRQSQKHFPSQGTKRKLQLLEPARALT